MKLLAISKAAFTSVNRDIYLLLSKEYNYQIKLVLPKKLKFSNKYIDCDPYNKEDSDCIALQMNGSERASRYKGLMKNIRNFKPDVIYFEDDPMTLIACMVGVWCLLNKKNLFVGQIKIGV